MIADAGAGAITREGARDAARAELSKAVYHRYDDPWPVRAFDAVVHWLGHLFARVAEHSPGGGAGALALVGIVLVLLAVAFWRLGPVRRERRAPGAVLPEHATSAALHRTRADEAAAAGRWREAVVARMRAVARELEERGVLDERPGRTADEIAREAGRLVPQLVETLPAAAMVFDRVAYGAGTATAADHAIVLAADAAAQHARPPRPAVPA